MRDTFIFYRSFYEALNDLPEPEQLKIYRAIAEYSLNFEEIELTGLSKTVFTLIKPQLEANNKRFMNGKKGGEHGIKGGRPKTPKEPQKNPKKTPNNNNNVNNNNNILQWEEFSSYALTVNPNLLESGLRSVYGRWLANDFKDNNGNPINNWKALLNKTIPHIETKQLRPLEKSEAVAALNVPRMMDKLLKDGYTKEQIKEYAN